MADKGSLVGKFFEGKIVWKHVSGVLPKKLYEKDSKSEKKSIQTRKAPINIRVGATR